MERTPRANEGLRWHAESGGAGGELDARVQSEVGVEFYRLSWSLGSRPLTSDQQIVSRASRWILFRYRDSLAEPASWGLQPDQATKPCLEGRRGFLGREERRLPACNRAQRRIAKVGALRNSNEVASYFGGAFL